MQKGFWFKAHWLLGAVFGVLLLVVGVSGAMLSYKSEILQMLNKQSYIVEASSASHKMSSGELLKNFQAKNPNAKINSITFSSSDNSSSVINIASSDPAKRKGENIYINPYTAEVLPSIKGEEFFMFFFRLHRWLTLSGESQYIGKHIVAITTIVAILLTIGGVIVYMPKIKRGFLKSMSINSKCKGRAFVSSLHSAVGMWVVPFFLIMSFSGLYWSYDWYREALFKMAGVQPLKRVAPQKGAKTAIDYDEISKVVSLFEQNVKGEFKNANLRVVSNDGKYNISYLFADATHFRETNTMVLNSQGVLKSTLFEEKKTGEKLMASMLPLHSGEYFGAIGQFLWFISSMAMGLFAITGYMLYYARYKANAKKQDSTATTVLAPSC